MLWFLIFLAVTANCVGSYGIRSNRNSEVQQDAEDLEDRSPYCLSVICRFPNRCCPGYVCRFNLFAPFFTGLCVREVNFFNILGVGSKPWDDNGNSGNSTTTSRPVATSTVPATNPPGTTTPAPVSTNNSTTTVAPSASSTTRSPPTNTSTSSSSGPRDVTIPPPLFSFSFTARSRSPKARLINFR